VAGSSNQALLVSVTLDGVTAQACYKAEAGERPLWDFADGLWRREVAPTSSTRCSHRPRADDRGARRRALRDRSLQWWVDDNLEDHYFTLRELPEFHDWFAALAAFDVVANNADRKAGHVLYDGARCWAIDNGLCFHEQNKLRTVIWSTPVCPSRRGSWTASTSSPGVHRRAGALPAPGRARDGPGSLRRTRGPQPLSAARRGRRLAALPLAADLI